MYEQACVYTIMSTRFTLEFQSEIHIEERNHFAFSLADVAVAAHAGYFGDACRDIALLGADLGQAVIEVLSRPLRDILVDPVPVVWVVEDHGG